MSKVASALQLARLRNKEGALPAISIRRKFSAGGAVPVFDPNKPFEDSAAPAFDASKPFESAVEPKPTETPVVDDHGLSERQKLSPVGKALSPITGYPETYSKMNKEAREQISHGIDQLAAPKDGWDVAKGIGNTALGALGYVASPVNAAYRSVAGQPIEDVTGIPREYTELAAQLATPGIGFTRMGKTAPGGVPEIQPGVAGKQSVPAAESAKELNIPLSRGQAAQDLDAIRYEDMASRGAYGPEAQERAARFFDEQFKAIQSAGSRIGEGVGRAGQKTDDIGASAGIVNTEVTSAADKAKAVVAEAERRAAAEATAQKGIVGDSGNALTDIIRGKAPEVSSTADAGAAVGQGVRQAADTAKDTYKGLYKEAFDLPGQFHAGTFENIGSRIRGDLTLTDSPVIVDDTTKIATRALDDIDKMSNLKFKNVADPFGAPNPENIIAVNLKGVDQARKLLVARYQQAKASGRATQDFSDQRAMEKIIDAFDDHIERSISNGLFSGDSRALDALQEARSSFSNYRKTYRPNPGDDVSQAMNRIVSRNATPEEIGNMVVGSGKIGNAGLPVRLADKLKTVLGEGSDQWSAVRQAIWQKASNVRNSAGEIDPAKSANSITDFANSTLARTVFKPDELAAMRNHANGVKELDGVIQSNPITQRAEQAKNMYQQAFGEEGIGGSQATVFKRIIDGTATPQETAQAVFGAVNTNSSGNVVRMLKAINKIAGPDSDSVNAIRQGVWQKLTKNAEGKDQPGQQKVAQAINEFLNGQGKEIAKQLYSPEELGLMKKYADAIKLTVIPPRAATRSDTAVGLLAALNKYSGAISSAIGGIFGHGATSVFAGYGVGKLLEKTSNGIKNMKELNRIRGQFEPSIGSSMMPRNTRPISTPIPSYGVSHAPRQPFPAIQGPVPAGAQDEQQ